MEQQVLLSVKKKRLRFFMELGQSLDFVQVEKEDVDSAEEIRANLTQTFKDLRRYKKGRLDITPAQDFLDEL